MQIKLLVDGGSMAPGPALSQKLGPAGINISQVIQKVNEATKDFKGLKVPVELDVDLSTKSFEVKIFSPPTSELIKKELKIEKGSGAQKKTTVGNLSIEQIISIAKTKMQNMLSKDLKASVRSVVGTCVSLGVLVESKSPVEVEQEILQGKYDKEIKEERTQTPPEKKKQLDQFFLELKEKQEKLLKAEQAAKEAEKAAAEAATAATPTTPAAAGTKTPVATPTATPVAEKKEEKKKK